MTFSERMQRVRTPEELDTLMSQVRRRGSTNWTLKTTRERVPKDLWPTLDAHFDEDGVILGWSSGEDPDAGEQPSRVSLVDLIRSLNANLLSARARAIKEHRELFRQRRREAEARAQDPADVAVAADEPPVPAAPAEPLEAEGVEAIGPETAPEAPEVPATPAEPESRPRPKRKRRLVRRPEKSSGPAPNANEPPGPVTSPTPRQPEPVEEKDLTGTHVEAYQSHSFADGWCSRCGTSTEAVLQWGDRCESAPPPTPKKKAAPQAGGAVGTHRFDGGWCMRCGLSRERATSYPCN